MVEVRAHRSADLPALAEALAPLGAAAPRLHAGTSRVTVPVSGGRAVIAAAVRALDGLDIDVDDIGLRRPTLDEVFLTLTGSPIDGDGPDDADTDPDSTTPDSTTTTGERAEPVAVA